MMALHKCKRFILKILASHLSFSVPDETIIVKETVFTGLSPCLPVGRYLSWLSIWEITLHAGYVGQHMEVRKDLAHVMWPDCINSNSHILGCFSIQTFQRRLTAGWVFHQPRHFKDQYPLCEPPQLSVYGRGNSSPCCLVMGRQLPLLLTDPFLAQHFVWYVWRYVPSQSGHICSLNEKEISRE